MNIEDYWMRCGHHKCNVMLIAIASIRAQIHSYLELKVIDASGIFKIESNEELEHSQ